MTRAETQELLCVPVDLSHSPNGGEWVQLHLLAEFPACEEAKHFGDPSLRVLGFKPLASFSLSTCTGMFFQHMTNPRPLSSLQDHHRMFHAYFVYPNERGKELR